MARVLPLTVLGQADRAVSAIPLASLGPDSRPCGSVAHEGEPAELAALRAVSRRGGSRPCGSVAHEGAARGGWARRGGHLEPVRRGRCSATNPRRRPGGGDGLGWSGASPPAARRPPCRRLSLTRALAADIRRARGHTLVQPAPATTADPVETPPPRRAAPRGLWTHLRGGASRHGAGDGYALDAGPGRDAAPPEGHDTLRLSAARPGTPRAHHRPRVATRSVAGMLRVVEGLRGGGGVQVLEEHAGHSAEAEDAADEGEPDPELDAEEDEQGRRSDDERPP